jgi:hypothetical protein
MRARRTRRGFGEELEWSDEEVLSDVVTFIGMVLVK